MQATTHVLLISAQAAPNLLPALDPDLKPREAILLVSEKMQSRADALEAVLKEADIKTSRVPLDNEHDLDSLQDAILRIAETRDGEAVALNVTGGTKLMALAAQSVAEAAGWSVFYVDVDTDEVIPLDKSGSRRPLATTLRLPHYLRAYGFGLDSARGQPRLRPECLALLRTLGTNASSFARPLGQLNWLAQCAADRKQLQVALSEEQQDSRNLEALLRHFDEAGVLRVEGDTLIFASEADRDFAKGGWLEQYVFRGVGAVSVELGVRDKAANLEVIDGEGVKNELDVAFLARNRLFVIECKTARMDGDRAHKANDTLFKLAEVCRRVGGLGARAMLASYRPLAESERRLAKALNIEVICGSELARLDERLKLWVGAL